MHLLNSQLPWYQGANGARRGSELPSFAFQPVFMQARPALPTHNSARSFRLHPLAIPSVLLTEQICWVAVVAAPSSPPAPPLLLRGCSRHSFTAELLLSTTIVYPVVEVCLTCAAGLCCTHTWDHDDADKPAAAAATKGAGASGPPCRCSTRRPAGACLGRRVCRGARGCSATAVDPLATRPGV